MELKLRIEIVIHILSKRLNRTFYGIETCLVILIKQDLIVLIVPFMELKQERPSTDKGMRMS